MFFKQIGRNASKNRKGNGLFFGSLVIAIIAFYTLLSLGEQDVMRFLATIESDAVSKLMRLLPIVYAVSLFFVFFLIYFACKYQIDSRRQELGMYLMLGMRRARLFFMLFCETLWSSLISLLIGIPAALFLTEGISLATARMVGLGIIGHQIAISGEAIFWTVCGFVFLQMLSMGLICLQLSKNDPADFLGFQASESQEILPKKKGMGYFAAGIVLLLIAYYLGIFRLKSLDSLVVLALLFCGIMGTFLFYRGLGTILGRKINRRRSEATGLEIFTARQVQERVLFQHKTLAISSLLLLMALSCVSFGISMGFGREVSSRSADFSLFGEKEQIDEALEQANVRDMIKDSYPMYLSLIKDEYWEGEEKAFDLTSLRQALASVEGTENILENLHIEYILAESSYNRLLKNIGKNGIELGTEKVALYTSMANEGDFGRMLEKAIGKGAAITVDQRTYEICPELYYDNAVADRSITLYMALIVPDELFGKWARETEPYCRNIHLVDGVTEEMGWMQTIQKVEEKIASAGIEYDSFLSGVGRNLFYTVAASYLTLYLGILFLLIANTAIGLKFLITQRQTKHRYVTLAMLGADTDRMIGSVRKQIRIFFSAALSLSVISGGAAVLSLFTSVAKLPVGVSAESVFVIAGLMVLLFILTEWIYIGIVKRTASREIRMLDITDRG